MSGGQMQRVAIARALVNDPDILLADEPTGALDTATSVQIMEILKEISKDKLIIMVTHNPELANTYSTRIIKVLDGLVTDDSDPYVSEKVVEEAPVTTKKKASKAKKATKKNKEKTSMSFWTALSLSFNNLRTKKGRTVMTSFAGSIGIIGIALILALSSGINAFISQVQEDTLSTYPLTIQKQTQDLSAMLSAMTSVSNTENYRDSGMIYVDDSLGTMMGAMSSTVENNLEAFKAYIEANYDKIKDSVSDIQYTYDYDLQIYTADGKVKVGMETVFAHMSDAFSGMSELMSLSGSTSMGIDVFSEMINNQAILDQQYDVIAGNWPTEYNEVVLVVNSNNQISKMTLYMLGVLDPNEIDDEMADLMNGKYESKEMPPFTYEDLLNMKFKLLTTSDFFTQTEKTYVVGGSDKIYPVWADRRDDIAFTDDAKATFITENGVEIKISGIIRPKEGASATSISGAIGYTKSLTDYILEQNSKSTVINQQKETPNVNVLTGLAFERTTYTRENIQELIDKIDRATMEVFYNTITNMILQGTEGNGNSALGDTSALFTVTRANINTMFMLLSEEQQAEILTRIVESAVANNPDPGTPSNPLMPSGYDKLQTTFSTISTMTGNITVTADNIVTLLPVLNKMETKPILTALGIPGIISLANATVVETVVENINTAHPELEKIPYIGKATADNLYMIISSLPVEEQTEIYTALVGSIDANNDPMVMILCNILSVQMQLEETLTKETLPAALASLPSGMQSMTMHYLAISGMPGLADYASGDDMALIYADMNEMVKNLKVNDEIFALLLQSVSDENFIMMESILYGMAPQIDATYDSVLKTLDDAEKASPASINFFAKDFESKDVIEQFIADYNELAKSEGRDSDVLEYSDLVGALMSSITIIINAISYVLIAFVSISLVVSSIMIGIITNISVLERTKEIGVLRAIGASKRDVSRVFNAETMIIGFAAGLLGIVITVLLCFPISAIVQYLTGIPTIRAYVPPVAAVLLVAISVLLTLIAGLIPARSAAKKDPVIALRTE